MCCRRRTYSHCFYYGAYSLGLLLLALVSILTVDQEILLVARDDDGDDYGDDVSVSASTACIITVFLMFVSLVCFLVGLVCPFVPGCIHSDPQNQKRAVYRVPYPVLQAVAACCAVVEFTSLVAEDYYFYDGPLGDCLGFVNYADKSEDASTLVMYFNSLKILSIMFTILALAIALASPSVLLVKFVQILAFFVFEMRWICAIVGGGYMLGVTDFPSSGCDAHLSSQEVAEKLYRYGYDSNLRQKYLSAIYLITQLIPIAVFELVFLYHIRHLVHRNSFEYVCVGQQTCYRSHQDWNQDSLVEGKIVVQGEVVVASVKEGAWLVFKEKGESDKYLPRYSQGGMAIVMREALPLWPNFREDWHRFVQTIASIFTFFSASKTAAQYTGGSLELQEIIDNPVAGEAAGDAPSSGAPSSALRPTPQSESWTAESWMQQDAAEERRIEVVVGVSKGLRSTMKCTTGIEVKNKVASIYGEPLCLIEIRYNENVLADGPLDEQHVPNQSFLSVVIQHPCKDGIGSKVDQRYYPIDLVLERVHSHAFGAAILAASYFMFSYTFSVWVLGSNGGKVVTPYSIYATLLQNEYKESASFDDQLFRTLSTVLGLFFRFFYLMVTSVVLVSIVGWMNNSALPAAGLIVTTCMLVVTLMYCASSAGAAIVNLPPYDGWMNPFYLNNFVLYWSTLYVLVLYGLLKCSSTLFRSVGGKASHYAKRVKRQRKHLAQRLTSKNEQNKSKEDQADATGTEAETPRFRALNACISNIAPVLKSAMEGFKVNFDKMPVLMRVGIVLSLVFGFNELVKNLAEPQFNDGFKFFDGGLHNTQLKVNETIGEIRVAKRSISIVAAQLNQSLVVLSALSPTEQDLLNSAFNTYLGTNTTQIIETLTLLQAEANSASKSLSTAVTLALLFDELLSTFHVNFKRLWHDWTNAFKASAILTFLFLVRCTVAPMYSFAKQLAARQRPPGGFPLKKTDVDEPCNCRMRHMPKILGVQYSTMYIGQLVLTPVLGLVILMFSNPQLSSEVVKKGAAELIPPGIALLLIFVVQVFFFDRYLLERECFQGGGGNSRTIKRPWHLNFILIISAFYGTFTGALLVVVRIVAATCFLFLRAFRVDLPALPAEFISEDPCYRSYLANLSFSSMYTNKVFLSSVDLLKDRQPLNPAVPNARTKVPLNRRQRARTRWHLMYTLTQNPSLVEERKHPRDPSYLGNDAASREPSGEGAGCLSNRQSFSGDDKRKTLHNSNPSGILQQDETRL